MMAEVVCVEGKYGRCCALFSNVILQGDDIDKWQWHLESNKGYTISVTNS